MEHTAVTINCNNAYWRTHRGRRAVGQGQKLREHQYLRAGTRRAIIGDKEARVREENQNRLVLEKHEVRA